MLNLDAAEKLMTGFWSKSERKKSDIGAPYVVYKWSGVYTRYTLLLNLGVDKTNPMILSYETNTDTPDPDAVMNDLGKRLSKPVDETGSID